MTSVWTATELVMDQLTFRCRILITHIAYACVCVWIHFGHDLSLSRIYLKWCSYDNIHTVQWPCHTDNEIMGIWRPYALHTLCTHTHHHHIIYTSRHPFLVFFLYSQPSFYTFFLLCPFFLLQFTIFYQHCSFNCWLCLLFDLFYRPSHIKLYSNHVVNPNYSTNIQHI